jgi:Fe-S-cluster-containing dehydrogenase component
MIGEGIQSTNQRKHSYVHDRVEVGFFTDPSVCIGCKACEVACKEWNEVPDDGFTWTGNSYDNTGHLGASTWRHVLFLEQDLAKGNQIAGPMSLGNGDDGEDPFRWVFLSDVCKHCEEAGCLEACPTGSIVRTEVGSVLVQNDVCNGCGYCVVSCPFGVIDRRPQPLPDAGGAFKRADSRPPAPKFVRRSRSSSVASTIFAPAPAIVSVICARVATATHNFTIHRIPPSAVFTPSSFC